LIFFVVLFLLDRIFQIQGFNSDVASYMPIWRQIKS